MPGEIHERPTTHAYQGSIKPMYSRDTFLQLLHILDQLLGICCRRLWLRARSCCVASTGQQLSIPRAQIVSRLPATGYFSCW